MFSWRFGLVQPLVNTREYLFDTPQPGRAVKTRMYIVHTVILS